MNSLPKDLHIYLGLHFDLQSIISFSQTSKKYYHIIWENNIFWINKLKEDFQIIIKDSNIEIRRKYWIELKKLNYSNLNEIYYYAQLHNRLDLIKIVLNNGVDINYKNQTCIPIVYAFFSQKIDLLDLLLERNVFNSRKNIITILKCLCRNTHDIDKNINLMKIFFDKILPDIYHKYNNKNFWFIAVNKLERFKEEEEEAFQDIYNRRIEELKMLT